MADEAILEMLSLIRADIAAMQPLVAGIPLTNRSLEAMRHDIRQIKAAINDIAAVQMTSGEAEALHADIDKTMTNHDALEARIIVLERLVRELQERRP